MSAAAAATSAVSSPRWARAFSAVGILAAPIVSGTPTSERHRLLASFRRGEHRILTSVYALVEGVDLPMARCGLFCAPFRYDGRLLQVIGRLLRADAGKLDAIMIDLTGTTAGRELPTVDRTYSLTEQTKVVGEQPPELVGAGGVARDIEQIIRGVPLHTVLRGALPADVVPIEAPVDMAAVERERRRLAGIHRMRGKRGRAA